ncbi:MAG: catalase family protein [Nevskia sp.]
MPPHTHEEFHMAYDAPQSPVLYTGDLEKPEADEAETLADLNDSLRKISETTFADSGHARRGVHAKSHGLLLGVLRVLDGLPPILRQGLFAQPGSYEAIMRLSTIPGDLLPDKVSTPRGMAIKLLGVPGARLPGCESSQTQDFVLGNGPAFSVPSAKKFAGTLKLLAKTTDKGENLKVALSTVMRGAEKLVEAVGGKSPLLMTLGGHPQTHILGESFYSQVPLRFGDHVAKISVVPVSSPLMALKGVAVELGEDPDGLRAAVIEFFAKNPAVWEVRAQLCTDLAKMPIEDASAVWPEELSPYLPVARIEMPRQLAWSLAKSAAIDDRLSFSPWHGLEAHRPLGSIMRARRQTYERSVALRARLNDCRIDEPESLAQLSL